MTKQASPYCRFCGERITPGAALCERCRNPVGETTDLDAITPTIPFQPQQPGSPYVSPAQQGYQQPGYQQQWQQPAPMPTPPTAPLWRSSSLPMIAVGALVLLLVLGAGAALLFNNKEPETVTIDQPTPTTERSTPTAERSTPTAERPRPTTAAGGKQPVQSTEVSEPTSTSEPEPTSESVSEPTSAPSDVATGPVPVPSAPGTPFTITPYEAPADLPPLEYWLETQVVPTSDAQEVEVHTVLTIRNPSADYYFTGVRYTIEAYDAAGNRLDEARGMLTLGPGEVSVQTDGSSLYVSPALFDHVEIFFEQDTGWVYSADQWPNIPLTVQNAELTPAAIGVKAEGELLIGGTETLETVWFSVVVRDTAGGLLAAERTFVKNVVPAEPTLFEVIIPGVDADSGVLMEVFPSLPDYFPPDR